MSAHKRLWLSGSPWFPVTLTHLRGGVKFKSRACFYAIVSSGVPLTPVSWCFQESTLHLVLRLRGGAKKRKKKSYTTPKKNKHKRKKVKLAVLKYYKVKNATRDALEFEFCAFLVSLKTLFLLQVDENGKIHRLRRECPADECGAGVFMASHFDRHYCGKCCLTYCFNKPEDK